MCGSEQFPEVLCFLKSLGTLGCSLTPYDRDLTRKDALRPPSAGVAGSAALSGKLPEAAVQGRACTVRAGQGRPGGVLCAPAAVHLAWVASAHSRCWRATGMAHTACTRGTVRRTRGPPAARPAAPTRGPSAVTASGLVCVRAGRAAARLKGSVMLSSRHGHQRRATSGVPGACARTASPGLSLSHSRRGDGSRRPPPQRAGPHRAQGLSVQTSALQAA